MIKLKQLLSAIITEEVNACVGGDDVLVTSVTSDSRKVEPGSMFVAVRGPINDGHDFIDDAIKKGAIVIVAEELPVSGHSGVTYVKVADSAVALGFLASEWYGNPSRKLRLVGVTGTNGKTTVATLLYRMAMASGEKAGLLSTVENRICDKAEPAVNTTPSPLEINRLLRKMVDEGCTFASMEVSSHGMSQRRTHGLHFAGGVFTNLTRDHLDYHGTFKSYLEAKKLFFDTLPSTAFALTNTDDANGNVMVQNTRARIKTYGLYGTPDFKCKVISDTFEGMELDINGIEMHTPFIGRFNASNLTAVFGAWVSLGHDERQTAVTLSAMLPVTGRFESFRSADSVTVIVDYAHTPDALENVLKTISEISSSKMEVCTVLGAGGDRDKGKRPLMGEVAARYSDTVIVTSDNPRNEEPAEIARQVMEGVDRHEIRTKARIVLDRAQAIEEAVLNASPSTIILIAGKGHENYQEFENKRRIYFSDAEHAVKALGKRDASRPNSVR